MRLEGLLKYFAKLEKRLSKNIVLIVEALMKSVSVFVGWESVPNILELGVGKGLPTYLADIFWISTGFYPF